MQSCDDDTTCASNRRRRSTAETSSSSEDSFELGHDHHRRTSSTATLSKEESNDEEDDPSVDSAMDVEQLDSEDTVRRNRMSFSLARPSFLTRRMKKKKLTNPLLIEETSSIAETVDQEDSTDEDDAVSVTSVMRLSTTSFPSLPSLSSSFRPTVVFRRFRGNKRVEKPEHLDEFKSIWNEKLVHTMEKIAQRTVAHPLSREKTGVSSSEPDLFHLLLQLYAHQDVIEDLYASYENHTEAFEFYIPQLCTFLIHGKYHKQHQLEFFLLSTSSISLLFAHRLIWFLNSFCTQAQEYTSESLSVTTMTEKKENDLLSAIHQHARTPATWMDQGLTMMETTTRNASLRRACDFEEEEKDVSLCDDEAFARYLQDKRRKVTSIDGRGEKRVALEKSTPAFARALTDLADRLIPLPLTDRNVELRKGLETIQEEFLPSNVIYLPIGNKFHRVKAIQIEECFTFSTKERVPYFMCVEVVDYAVVDDENCMKTSLLRRRKMPRRKFSIKLPFKSKSPTESESTSTLPSLNPSSPLVRKFSSGHQLTGSSEIIVALNTILNNPSTALALTPDPSPLSVTRDQMDDNEEEEVEEELEEETTDVEQKKRLGQWNLPRIRGRKRDQESEVDTAAKATRFGKFYSTWFTKRSDSKEAEDQADSETLSAHDCSDNEEVSDQSMEPSPEPQAVTTTNIQLSYDATSSDEEDGGRQPKGRYTSQSLDFTDPIAWKDNYELGEIVTEIEADANLSEQTETVERLANAEDSDDDVEEDELPVIVFRERWCEKQERIRQYSPYAAHPGWRLLPVIVKSNDDLRQEQFAAQLIAQCDLIFRGYKLPLKLRPYNVIATSATTGLIEAVPDTVSLDSLKRNDSEYTTLLEFYRRMFGQENTSEFQLARRNFVESLAAYSILCYVFQIKDRHNGNILLDAEGHVIHIDFGFLLTNSPGSNMGFETAPFKLTDEFVELMGGPRSATFRYFRSLCIRAYLALRRNMERIVLLVEMMLIGSEDLPCFAGGKDVVIEELKERFKPGARTSECQVFVNGLIDQSINNWRTRWYDKYQRACVGIM